MTDTALSEALRQIAELKADAKRASNFSFSQEQQRDKLIDEQEIKIAELEAENKTLGVDVAVLLNNFDEHKKRIAKLEAQVDG